MSIVAALDAMRFEHQVIPHPNRVEAIGLRALRAFKAFATEACSQKCGSSKPNFRFVAITSISRFAYFLHNPT